MDASTSKFKGDTAEQSACDFLLDHGLVLLERNYHCKAGEIDLIMLHKDKLVFVEVRYRRHNTYGSAAESVHYSKQQKIISCAQYYLYLNPEMARQQSRFDVICASPGHPAFSLHWIKDAFHV